MDEVLDIIEDGTSTHNMSSTVFLVALAFVLVATLFFVVMYMRYKNLKKEHERREQENLERKGAVDLQRRCLDLHGNVRESVYSLQKEETQQAQNAGTATKNADGQKEKKGVGEQIYEVVTNGKLVGLLNKAMSAKKVIERKLNENEKPQSPQEYWRAQRMAELADESINPLFRMKTQPPPQHRKRRNSDDSSSSSESSSEEEEFDKEDVVQSEQASRFTA